MKIIVFSIALLVDAGLGFLGFSFGRRSVAVAPLPATAADPVPPVVESREPLERPGAPLPPRRRSLPSLEGPISPGRALTFADIENACGDLMERYANFLCLVNRGSEVVVGGARRVLTEDLASFSIRITKPSGVGIEVEGKNRYSLEFGPPEGERLVRGIYPKATRWPFNKGPYAGIDFSDGSYGCNEEEGQFRILEYDLQADNKVLRFVADFETNCNDGIGRVSIAAGVQLPPERPVPKIEIHRHEPGGRDRR